jgi:phosphoesterase family protein
VGKRQGDSVAGSNFVPPYDHIVVVVEENHSYDEIIGSSQAPYINSLARSGALLSSYRAVAHPSEPNYFALYAGSTFGVIDDGTHQEPGPTLGSILAANGRRFVGYVESGSPARHNPWESFPEGFSVEQNVLAFPSDFSGLPTVSFVVPNLADDMHDGSIGQGDAWLQSHIDAYAHWAVAHNSLLIITFDEDDSSQANRVPTMLLGAHIATGVNATPGNHYDLLHTILQAFGLPAPNSAANASGLDSAIFLHDPPQITDAARANDLNRTSSASGFNHFIDYLNFEASYTDLVRAFGMNQQAMQDWYSRYEPTERRVETFDGLDYIASYGDLINAFRSVGSMHDVQDAGASHYITYGSTEGRTTTFNGLDYIASYGDLIAAYGANNDAGAFHYIEYGYNEHRTTAFDGLDYIASYGDLIRAYGADEQAGAAHFINWGFHEGRTTAFDGLSYIAQYPDLMHAFGANNDAGAAHYITYGYNEGRSTTFDVGGYLTAHPYLQGRYASNDQFLAAYIDSYVATGNFLT